MNDALEMIVKAAVITISITATITILKAWLEGKRESRLTGNLADARKRLNARLEETTEELREEGRRQLAELYEVSTGRPNAGGAAAPAGEENEEEGDEGDAGADDAGEDAEPGEEPRRAAGRTASLHMRYRLRDPVSRRANSGEPQPVPSELLVAQRTGAVKVQEAQREYYGAQIEKYQDQTRARASWSFIVALLAMGCGLIALIACGYVVLTAKQWEHVVAGSLIATIGSVLSGYITKTFLSVHRLSLQQLDKYFQQPVLNDNILTATQLADRLNDPSASDAKRDAIRSILAGLNTHIAMPAPSAAPPTAGPKPMAAGDNLDGLAGKASQGGLGP